MSAITYAREHATAFRQQLHDFLAISSVSTEPEKQPEMYRAAQWLMQQCAAMGLAVELIEADGHHPMVYAEYMSAADDAKTVLIYGHYDVQPAVKEDGWDTEPFTPIEKDGFIWARGATDDKGQTFIHLKAVEALLKAEGQLPVNVKFIIEGEEEAGSRFIGAYLPQHAGKLAADVVVISDTSMAKIEEPVIINALRGFSALEVTVTGPKQDLHSGMFGGTVHNPALALAQIIAQLHDEKGNIAVPGFYDNVAPLDDAERIAMENDYPLAVWQADTGAPEPWGDERYSLRARLGARPTLEINGMAGGYFGDGFKAIVPHKAWAKISCRLVANQNPQRIGELVRDYIQSITPKTVSLDVQIRGGGLPALVKTDTPMMEAAIRAYERGWGARPVFKREGGSIPIVSAFQNQLNAPVILMGFGLNSDNLHGPNEHFSIEMFHKGIETMIIFMEEVSNL